MFPINFRTPNSNISHKINRSQKFIEQEKKEKQNQDNDENKEKKQNQKLENNLNKKSSSEAKEKGSSINFYA